MTLSLDGFEILRRIGASPAAFPSLEHEAAAIAETIVTTELLSKDLDRQGFAALLDALGEDTITLVLETLTQRQLRALAKSIDFHAGKRGGALLTAKQLIEFVRGRTATDIVEQPDPDQHAPKGKASRTATPLGTGSMRASRSD